jgi:SAM-dependent methyltransferase
MTELYRSVRRAGGKVLRSVPWVRRQMAISCDYTLIDEQEAHRRSAGGWHSPLTALRQARAYEALLQGLRTDEARIDLRTAAEAVDALARCKLSLLEVGCGSGYYSEVFARLARTTVNYTGIDYSKAMIQRAKRAYPREKFAVGNATALSYADDQFDVVFNGVSLMHILQYKKAIAESARVAARAVIFHSVPVLRNHSTAFLHKYAYGSPVVEVVFNRDELMACFRAVGLTFCQSWTTIEYDVSHVVGEVSWSETFLCLKNSGDGN